jgi:RNA polymerase sigma-70 factor (ECF subfamily)
MGEPDQLLADELDSGRRHELLQSVFERWSADVFGFALARCGSRPVAEDVTSEVFVAAARAIGGSDPDQVTRSWLLTTARRRLIDQWRRQSTQRNTAERLRSLSIFRTGAGADEPDRVHRALATLPDGQRLALTLRYLDDHSVAEVADELAVSYAAAESLLARARRSFQRAWEQQ